MVPWHPEDLAKAFLDLGEGYAAMLCGLADIAAEYQVIVRVREELLESFAVAFEREVYIADTPETARWRCFGAWRGARWGTRRV